MRHLRSRRTTAPGARRRHRGHRLVSILSLTLLFGASLAGAPANAGPPTCEDTPDIPQCSDDGPVDCEQTPSIPQCQTQDSCDEDEGSCEDVDDECNPSEESCEDVDDECNPSEESCDEIVDECIPETQTGTYPDCVDLECNPDTQTGTFPDCVDLVACNADTQSGDFQPDCVDLECNPDTQTGTFPDCVDLESCPIQASLVESKECDDDSPPPPNRSTGDASHPGLDLTVTASPPSAGPGDVVTFTWTIQNTGDVDLTGVGFSSGAPGGFNGFTASTSLDPMGTGTPLAASALAGISVPVHGSHTTTTTHTVTEADLPGPLRTSGTATANGLSATTTIDVDLVAGPAIAVQVTPDVTSLDLVDGETASITWTYRVSNVGDVTLGAVTLSDALAGTVDLGGVASLAPGEATTVTVTRPVTAEQLAAGAATAVATATGVAFDGSLRSATDTASVALSLRASSDGGVAEVLGVVEERDEPAPAPDPAPAPAPAPAPMVASESLPATGAGHDQAALLALLLLIAGGSLVRVTRTSRRERRAAA